jgi:hypothetical protein
MSSQAPRPITPRNIVPLSDEVTGASPVRATVPHLKYHGGPVLGAAEIVTIFWGPFWSMAAGVSLIAHLNAFFESILTSSLIDLLAEYDTPHTKIGHGKRVASFSDITKNPGRSPLLDNSSRTRKFKPLFNNGSSLAEFPYQTPTRFTSSICRQRSSPSRGIYSPAVITAVITTSSAILRITFTMRSNRSCPVQDAPMGQI